MSDMIAWIAAEAEQPEADGSRGSKDGRKFDAAQDEDFARGIPDAQSAESNPGEEENEQSWQERRQEELELNRELERERRIYRGRTIGMLRRYFRYAMECGRLPSILGSEFFRSQVTSYTVVTFEDRAIFVHDMETCLEKLDEFSRQLIGRHILQEHDRWATAKLLHCNEKTVRRFTPIALDMLSEILLDVGLLERTVSIRETSCQGGHSSEISVSDCEEGKYKF
jgi:hypothetical protein